ncbi:MAG: hypothetical protein H8Z69_05635 [Nanohaloarchaea archaeon]|nr:hypothetical protein [Candidatus Nanohaloarchaea archaeon]
MNVLGISCYYHDSSACLVKDGEVVAAVSEERFSREKHDRSFPQNAVDYCLRSQEVEASDVDKVVFYEKPVRKLSRVLETSSEVFPRGFKSFRKAMVSWTKTKLRIKSKIRSNFPDADIEFVPHHRSHAASAFHPSPFDEAAVLTADSTGEYVTNQMFEAEADSIEPIKSITFPDSLGLLYSTITSFLGFRVNNGESKVMGLAAYGNPNYLGEMNELIEVEEDGFYSLNMDYFGFRVSETMWSDKLKSLLGEPRSERQSIESRHRDIAASLQRKIEEVLLKQAEHLHDITGKSNLCMAGGIALNCRANQRIAEETSFENVWVQPAAGDAGGAMGAALERTRTDYSMESVYLGPKYSSEEVENVLNSIGAEYRKVEKKKLVEEVSERISDGEIVGIFRGRAEWGPRALGNRSIIADPRKIESRERINRKIKYRENFRPFAPTVISEKASEYFTEHGNTGYMLFTQDASQPDKVPAVVHENDTSRIQVLRKKVNPFFYQVIKSFEVHTGVPMVLNTSFNKRGEPIVNTPSEAYRCFKSSGLDFFVTEKFIIEG